MPTAPNRSLTMALWANAALLALIALTLISRSGGGSMLPAALAQAPNNGIAGGSGLYVSPAQFSGSTWGCYVMDVDRQILMAYQYFPGEKILRLTAARNFAFDRRLPNYNTEPNPQEVKAWADKADDTARQQVPDVARPPVEPNGQ